MAPVLRPVLPHAAAPPLACRAAGAGAGRVGGHRLAPALQPRAGGGAATSGGTHSSRPRPFPHVAGPGRVHRHRRAVPAPASPPPTRRGARIARRGHGFAGEGGEVMSMTPRPVEPAEVLAGPRARATVREAYPPFEGSNIGVWLGFKHFMYLMEEAAIQHVRERWLGRRALWEQHGVGVEIVDSSIRILAALHLDQLTRVEVRPREGSEECELGAILEAQDGGQWVPAASGSVKVLFRRSPESPGALPEEILPHVRDEIERDPLSPSPIRREGPGRTGPAARPPRPPGATAGSFVWKRRIPYFYCHFMDRLQHSGYVRLMEEVVDLFLAERGISIGAMLERRSWIPVVAEAGLEILREARLGEEIC